MKPIILIFAGILLVLAASAQAYIYELNHTCENSCLQETGVVFNLTIDPGKWQDAMELQKIEIVDSKRGTLVALYNESTSVSSKRTFYISAILPKYQGQLLINVSPCFTTRVPSSQRMAEDTFIANELTYCEKNNHTLPLLECMYPGSCDDGSSCYGNTCAKLKCSECQHIFDHSCISYQCCINDSCSFSQECINNSCMDVGCAESEFPQNHTCVKLACAPDEQMANHSCIKVPAVNITVGNNSGNNSNSTAGKAVGRFNNSTQRFLKSIEQVPKHITSAVVYSVLEVAALAAIVFLLLKILEAKTKIFIKLTNRGQK
jgi:hypothetical protein